jgi:hypothetical protein
MLPLHCNTRCFRSALSHRFLIGQVQASHFQKAAVDNEAWCISVRSSSAGAKEMAGIQSLRSSQPRLKHDSRNDPNKQLLTDRLRHKTLWEFYKRNRTTTRETTGSYTGSSHCWILHMVDLHTLQKSIQKIFCNILY